MYKVGQQVMILKSKHPPMINVVYGHNSIRLLLCVFTVLVKMFCPFYKALTTLIDFPQQIGHILKTLKALKYSLT